ncbi:MAG: LOG family protein [Phycisphaerae bacterium]|nr:LOG family protein [Phycisphaerae bacterium]NUQ44977.1 LOG family protein [Phycisphaerae bacterium]
MDDSSEYRLQRDTAIRQFVSQFAPGPDADLFIGMMTTICRLSRDECGRGELKILDSALKELRYAFRVFAPYRQIRKVSIFGSSRTPEGHPDYVQAVRFAERMRHEEWMVITGAGDGIMKAGHGGAGPEASFGVAIRLPFEQRTNVIIENDPKLVNFKYFFTRKLMFMKEASAVALFPGGFGTQDEGFEALTLVQTGKAPIVPIVMIDAPGGTYWQHWRTYVAAELVRTHMISEEDMNLFHVFDDADAAARHIVRFYRNYHSSRFVRDRLILRLNAPVTPEVLDHLNGRFGDIGNGGRIETVAAAVEEADDFPEKPRLAVPFNRRSHGRLRKLIDEINEFDLATEPDEASLSTR